MDKTFKALKDKLQNLEISTEEIESLFSEIKERIACLEFPVNGDTLQDMLVKMDDRLSKIESDIHQMKQDIGKLNEIGTS